MKKMLRGATSFPSCLAERRSLCRWRSWQPLAPGQLAKGERKSQRDASAPALAQGDEGTSWQFAAAKLFCPSAPAAAAQSRFPCLACCKGWPWLARELAWLPLPKVFSCVRSSLRTIAFEGCFLRSGNNGHGECQREAKWHQLRYCCQRISYEVLEFCLPSQQFLCFTYVVCLSYKNGAEIYDTSDIIFCFRCLRWVTFTVGTNSTMLRIHTTLHNK